MNFTISQVRALKVLCPEVVITNGVEAFDADGNQVEYDLDAVNDKAEEMQVEEEAKNTAAMEKLAAFGLTPEDLRRILG